MGYLYEYEKPVNLESLIDSIWYYGTSHGVANFPKEETEILWRTWCGEVIGESPAYYNFKFPTVENMQEFFDELEITQE